MKKWLFLIIFLLPLCGNADSGIQSEIDWNSGRINATVSYSIRTDERGIPYNFSAPGAKTLNLARMIGYREAEKIAKELIMSRVREIRIDHSNAFADILLSSTFAQREMSHVLYDKIESLQSPDGFYAVKSNASLKLSHIIATLPFEYPNEEFPDFGTNVISTDYTSLIIDARGLNIEPMVFPEIFDEQGISVFNRYRIDIQYASENGLVSYCYNENEAQKSPKSGARPFYTVALASLKNSPVLSNDDIDRIFSSEVTKSNLKKCKVIFIIDR